MTTILIISNVIFIGLWLLALRSTRRKSLLLKAEYQWRQSGIDYQHVSDKHKWHDLAQAAKKQQLTNDCVRLDVPQPTALSYIPESWMD